MLSRPGSLIGWRWIVVVVGVPVLCCRCSPAPSPLACPRSPRRSWRAASSARSGWRSPATRKATRASAYQDGANTFVWDSGEQLLTGIYGAQSIRLPRAADLVPAALAIRIINEAGPHAKASIVPPRRVAGQSAAGLEITPTAPQSTLARADIWASPATGLPLLVEVFDRGSAQPAMETQFLQAGAWTPDPGVLTPQRGPGAGFTTTTPSDFSGVLNNLDDELLPGRLAGLARRSSPVPQVGVYGSGLTVFAVLTFRHDTGGQLLANALDAGAARLTLANGTGAVASAPLVNLVLVHPYRSPDTFLLVGLVTKAALEQAAGGLAAKPDQDTSH